MNAGQMQAPEVTVVLRGTKYVTMSRRVVIFKELWKGDGGQGDSEYNHVRRGYNREVGAVRPAAREVKLIPAWGGCGLENRLDSPVYRGLCRMMQEAGFATILNEKEELIRIEPLERWREKVEDSGEDSDLCVVRRAGKRCKYCEYCESVSRGETESRDSEMSGTKADVGLEEQYGDMSVEERGHVKD
jgi:hypothetical protein